MTGDGPVPVPEHEVVRTVADLLALETVWRPVITGLDRCRLTHEGHTYEIRVVRDPAPVRRRRARLGWRKR